MRLLLDTDAFLWWSADDPTLGAGARVAVGHRANDVFVSVATAWEIATKRASGRLEAPGDIAEWIAESGFGELPIEVAHAARTAELPWHHRDPFDRLLVAQAQLEHLTLLTGDRTLARYDVPVLDARS